jgi:hypothetical protein
MVVQVEMLDYENMVLIFKNVLNDFSMDFYQTYLMREKRENMLDSLIIPRSSVKYKTTKYVKENYPPHIEYCKDEFLRLIRSLVHCPWTMVDEAIDSEYGPNTPDGGYLKPSRHPGYTCTMLFSVGQTRKFYVSEGKSNRVFHLEHNSLICLIGPTLQEKYSHAIPPLLHEDPQFHYNLLLKFL